MRSNIALLIFTKCFFYGFDIFLRYSVCRCVVIFEENILSNGFSSEAYQNTNIFCIFYEVWGFDIFFEIFDVSCDLFFKRRTYFLMAFQER